MKGTVKWFDAKKGYGFVIGEDTKEYFAHYTAITGEGFRKLEEGASVEFEPGTNEKGDTATQIVCIAG